MITEQQIGANIAAKAKSHVGEHEEPLGSNAGERVNIYLAYVGLGPGNPWCAAYGCWVVGMVLLEMGLPNYRHPRTGSSGAIRDWGKAHGRIVSEDDVQPGDIGLVNDEDTETGERHTVIALHPIDDDAWATAEGNFRDAVSLWRRDVGDCTWVRPWTACEA